MAGTGSLDMSYSAVGNVQSTRQYDVTCSFNIAFNYGGWNNSGAYYAISCNGATQDGSTTFSVSNGGGSWVWTHIGTRTFRVTMDSSGSAKTVSASAYINTGINPSTISASNSITLPAVTWQWPVYYDANGGSGAPGAQNKIYGQTLTLSGTIPSRAGHTFLGWSTTSWGGVEYQPNGGYTHNGGTTLYAVWRINTWQVYYNANGGSGAPGEQTKTYGQTLYLSNDRPWRTNHDFLGWSTSSTATSPQYYPGSAYTANQGATLYAVWKLSYVIPKIDNLSVYRCNSSGEEQFDGTNGALSFYWECCQLAGNNPVASIVANVNGVDITIPASGGSGTVTNYVVGSNALDIDSTYNISVRVTDTVGGSISGNITLPTSAFPIDFKSGGKGVAIGKTATLDNTLETAFEVRSTYKDCGFRHIHPDTGTQCCFGVSSYGGMHHGMWSDTAGIWPLLNDGRYTYVRTNAGGGTIGTPEAPFQEIYDPTGKVIRNGVAKWAGDPGENPDTTLEHCILTKNNTPHGRWYLIKTDFIEYKRTDATRIQMAYPTDHGTEKGIYYRRYNNGWTTWNLFIGEQKVLWSGNTQLGENQHAQFSEAIDQQTHGVILHWNWGEPDGSYTSENDCVYNFIPKWHVFNRAGNAVQQTMTTINSADVGRKWFWVGWGGLTGRSHNTGGHNAYWWLRTVLGV